MTGSHTHLGLAVKCVVGMSYRLVLYCYVQCWIVEYSILEELRSFQMNPHKHSVVSLTAPHSSFFENEVQLCTVQE